MVVAWVIFAMLVLLWGLSFLGNGVLDDDIGHIGVGILLVAFAFGLLVSATYFVPRDDLQTGEACTAIECACDIRDNENSVISVGE